MLTLLPVKIVTYCIVVPTINITINSIKSSLFPKDDCDTTATGTTRSATIRVCPKGVKSSYRTRWSTRDSRRWLHPKTAVGTWLQLQHCSTSRSSLFPGAKNKCGLGDTRMTWFLITTYVYVRDAWILWYLASSLLRVVERTNMLFIIHYLLHYASSTSRTYIGRAAASACILCTNNKLSPNAPC